MLMCDWYKIELQSEEKGTSHRMIKGVYVNDRIYAFSDNYAGRRTT